MFKQKVAIGLLALAGGVFADAISPASYSANLDVGGSVTITKTVTVTHEAPTTAPVDVYFLADETGSMGGTIAAIKAGAASIMSSVAGLGDVQFAVGGYRDVGSEYPSSHTSYRMLQDFTSNTAAVQTGINTWAASGGGDLPEADLFGLQSAANGASWRAGSTRILVWFGDAPGHDPSSGATLATATGALTAKNIQVQAIDVGSMNSSGQATSIATATDGHYYSGINSSSIVSTITSAITTTIDEYSSVKLAVEGLGTGVGVNITPVGGYTGAYTRATDKTFDFNVTFTGLTAGADENFKINALVDGGVVAVETDHITVNGTTGAVPEPGTLALMGLGLVTLVGASRRRK